MRKSSLALFCLVVIAAGRLSAQQPSSVDDNHWRDFKRKLIWKGPLAKTVLSAGFNQVINSPREWDRTWEGFGKRAANSAGQRAIKATMELAVSEWTHEDLHYHRLREGGFARRLGHAVSGTFWVRRDNGSDGYTLAAGRISGAFAAGQLSRTWMPSRVATFRSGMTTFGAAMGLDVAWNVFSEFWPRKH